MDVENLRETATERMRYIGSSGTGCVATWRGMGAAINTTL